MSAAPIIVSLPISDPARSRSFYAASFGFHVPGAPAEDGVPEPLILAVNDGLEVMLIPTGGFGWVTGDHQVAEPGTVRQCLPSSYRTPTRFPPRSTAPLAPAPGP